MTDALMIAGVRGITKGAIEGLKGGEKSFVITARIDCPIEVEYYRHGVLQYVPRQLLAR